ncbi:DUF664 domain-containing protein [Cryobacterium sp. BB736]|uniref:mycothiol transferase n=1 Tax=Cryobacterium sp. BB736 TaxID=2746963 RepID=UPI001876C792|nr:DUF664 domain-containing protein [Cryobacterium sp. BB736]
MSIATNVLTDAFGRVRDSVHHAVSGLGADQLAHRLDPDANSIGWLVWHLTRIQDDHVAGVAGSEQLWTSAGWADRFGLPFNVASTGYGHRSADVAALAGVTAEQLLGYHDAVHARTVEYVGTLDDADFDRIVDTSWDPPVTLAVRLVSVIADDLQHAGQAAFVRGIVERRR